MIEIEKRLKLAARMRPLRTRTTQIVVHRFGSDAIGFGVDDVEHFFTEDPEGVATVTMSGFYRHKIPIINRWKREGVPDLNKMRSFVPYHVAVDGNGRAVQFLPWDAKGAHDMYSNGKSIGIAMLGDFRYQSPTLLQLSKYREVVNWMTTDEKFALLVNADQGQLTITTHDDSRRRHHEEPKGCPGKLFPFTVDGLQHSPRGESKK